VGTLAAQIVAVGFEATFISVVALLAGARAVACEVADAPAPAIVCVAVLSATRATVAVTAPAGGQCTAMVSVRAQ
jgi:hypothetical protein